MKTMLGFTGLPPWRFAPSSAAHDAAKADVAARAVDHLRLPGGGPEPVAIVGCAQERAALEHLAWNFDVGLRRVEAQRPRRLVGRGGAAAAGERLSRAMTVPVDGPLPDVAG